MIENFKFQIGQEVFSNLIKANGVIEGRSFSQFPNSHKKNYWVHFRLGDQIKEQWSDESWLLEGHRVE